jgi:CheY-specific phosphatase CheX
MELFKVHTKILMPFVDETLKAVANMAHLKAKPLEATQEEVNSFSFQGYAVCVVANIFGEIEGKVLMHFHKDTALLIGNKVMSNLLGEESEEAEINEEIGDALSEFSNTVIGRATRALRESDLKITFQPPIFITGPAQMKSTLQDVVEILTIPIMLAGSKHFCLSYLLHHSTNKF